MMKKLFVLFLVLCLAVGCCACGVFTLESPETETTVTRSLEDEARHQTEIQVMGNLIARFRAHTSYVNVDITTFREIGDNQWEAFGKASFSDEYGDRYSGKWSAKVSYNPERDSFGVSIESDKTFYKD